ncbi:hypothetical protein AB0875_07260 [Micromonospora gifhornensis]|uniref:hypothetical protein n=1 Tax=Micromonospora TaxID=1873 RepID=UPI000F874FBF|nr:hypothetical protein [Verrucosispora sp. FIM060022]RUL90862.1 hypothetical protein EG812_24210 [Verrucosispora sp. FIM060022]
MASPDASSAPDGTAGPGGASPPAEPQVGRAPEHTFTNRWRRLWRRQPGMSHLPVDLDHAIGLGLLSLVIGAISGTALILLIPSTPLLIVFLAILPPYLDLHVAGVRHRWWALGAGTAAGVPAGLGINALLEASIGAQWATLIGILVGSAIGILTHAAVTHLPSRRT